MAPGTRYLGLFRWRGHLNWKDIVERAISGFGGAAVFYMLIRLFGYV